jgi:hypothetical protein
MRILSALLLCCLPAASTAQTLSCPDDRITVVDAGEYSDRICRVGAQAIDELAACNLPLDRPITITLSRTLDENCVGVYHCGEDTMELTHPDDLATMIAESALFSALDVLSYFDSILFHELVHAAADTIPCPYESCPATSEYLAYALQIRALSAEDREKIGLAEVSEDRISRDAINAIMVFWAPDRFAVKAWTHLMQREDPCAYVGLIAKGNIVFDFEHP